MEVRVKGDSDHGEGATSKLGIWYSNWRLFIVDKVSFHCSFVFVVSDCGSYFM